jgi:RNA polymerase sigma factor (sigma-70 family)
MSHDSTIVKALPNYPAKDAHIFTSAFTTFRNALCAFALTLISKYAADDIVSNVFIKLWEKSLEFDRFEKIQAWLYMCIRRACWKYAQRNRYDFMPVKMMESLLTDDDGPHKMAREEALTQIVIAVKKLPRQRRRVFTLYCVQSKKMGDVAAILKINLKTAYKHKELAKEQVREHLRQWCLRK